MIQLHDSTAVDFQIKLLFISRRQWHQAVKRVKNFLLCSNADRSNKMQILVIGKAKRPRAFLNQELPVEYKPTRNAWMTTKIFKEWFHSSFVRQVRKFAKDNNLPPKAVLLVDKV
ncbi:DDE superfamily endonuclease [Popillia japonica]|uniref:DDE superfamily endonuclease n=1 Tax=Popillia japonica TaxID=7064 RepID=A0AAW1KIF5_POPJA